MSKWWSYSVEGLLSTGPTPSSLYSPVQCRHGRLPVPIICLKRKICKNPENFFSSGKLCLGFQTNSFLDFEKAISNLWIKCI